MSLGMPDAGKKMRRSSSLPLRLIILESQETKAIFFLNSFVFVSVFQHYLVFGGNNFDQLYKLWSECV